MQKIAGGVLLLFAALLTGGCYNEFFKDREARIEDDAVIRVIAPDRSIYEPGEPLDLTGLVVIAEYPEGSAMMYKGMTVRIPESEGYSLSWNGKAPRNGDTDITAQPGIATITAEWRGLRGDCAIFVRSENPDDADFDVTDAAGWRAALAAISRDAAGTEDRFRYYTLNIRGTISAPGTTADSFTGEYKIMTLQGNGTLSLDGTGSLLRIGKNQTVLINGPTLRGGDGNDARLVVIEGSAELRKGSIEGNATGGVYIAENGSFTMIDGIISGNSASNSGDARYGGLYGGGVYIERNGSFTMIDGVISGNSADSFGGGGVYGVGSFTMAGGIISGNSAGSSGGGVYIAENGSFAMTEGIISGNSARDGGGVYVRGNFTMTEGIISGNTVTGNYHFYTGASGGKGGGVYVYIDGSFTMSGGIISGNSAEECVGELGNDSGRGGGVYSDRGNITKTGGIIYGNDAGSNANTAAGSDNSGHAVVQANFLRFSAGAYYYDYYYRNGTLGKEDDISASDLIKNWTSGGQIAIR